jgi:putative acetyltransferase
MECAIVIDEEDVHRADVRDLLEVHLAFTRSVTPAGYSCALDADALDDAAVTLFSARRHGELLAIGALKQLDPTHAELKSMHTRAASRGRGVGRSMVAHLLDVARVGGVERVSLETGTMEAFAPARALYTSVGFLPCGPFGAYEPSPYNTFMSISLTT